MLTLWVLAVLAHAGVQGGFHSHVEAHGPLARQALDSMVASGGLQYHPGSFHSALVASTPVAPAPVAFAHPAAAPVAFAHPAAAPVAFRAPAVTPVDVIHHVPSVADVPVTKYLTQPGYVQKLVDIPKARVAVAKLQVRRPAIQKQFYDIEERTIVRPVGSAVLELEEPISKKFVGPFTTVNTGYHTTAQFYRPFLYPGGSYPFVSYAPFQVPVQHYNPAFIQQTPHFPITQPPQQFPQQPVGIAPRPPQQLPQPPQQPVASAPQPPQQPVASAPQPPQQFPSFPSAAPPASPSPDESSSEFDSSDTIVVDNPDFGRSNKDNESTEKDDKKEETFEDFEKQVSENENTLSQRPREQDQNIQNILNDFESRQLLRSFPRQSSNMISRQFQNFQILLEPPQYLQQQVEERQEDRQKEDEPLQEAKIGSTSEASASTQSENIVKANKQDTSATSTEIASIAESRSYSEEKNANLEKFFSEGQIPSGRNLRPQELQENQQKLIELLTGRGEVSEVSLSTPGVKLSQVGDSGVVRGRVISVTPAPRNQGGEAEGEERVSTRRVVVSRPIQTLEEVDVHQPFTKLERVAVHEPALVRTAHPHVARVSTAVPVVSRAFAPLLYH